MMTRPRAAGIGVNSVTLGSTERRSRGKIILDLVREVSGIVIGIRKGFEQRTVILADQLPQIVIRIAIQERVIGIRHQRDVLGHPASDCSEAGNIKALLPRRYFL